jgi:hypothetical protein
MYRPRGLSKRAEERRRKAKKGRIPAPRKRRVAGAVQTSRAGLLGREDHAVADQDLPLLERVVVVLAHLEDLVGVGLVAELIGRADLEEVYAGGKILRQLGGSQVTGGVG